MGFFKLHNSGAIGLEYLIEPPKDDFKLTIDSGGKENLKILMISRHGNKPNILL